MTRTMVFIRIWITIFLFQPKCILCVEYCGNNRTVVSVEEEDVILPVNQTGIRDVTWVTVNGGNHFATTKPGGYVDIRDNRYEGRLYGTADGSLNITKLTKEDEGEYRANIRRNRGNTKCNQLYHLTVFNEPKELRLVGGLTKCEGRVEVKYQGEWGTACDDGWDMGNTIVVCKQLGCSHSHINKHPSYVNTFGPGSGKIWLDNVRCTGAESTLWECPRSVWGISNCDHREDIGVVCEGGAEELRLVGGRTKCEGRVEVKYQGEWGTVCVDDWNMDNTAVVCKQLGCNSSHGKTYTFQVSSFGAGTGKIWLDDVKCTGAESTLWECNHQAWGKNNCNHSMDTGVICKDQISIPASADPLLYCVLTAKALSVIILGIFLTVDLLLATKKETDKNEEFSIKGSQDTKYEANRKPFFKRSFLKR